MKLLHANAVCFDVDSTVITEEGIDVLAEFNGAGAAVADWTRKLVLSILLVSLLSCRIHVLICLVLDLKFKSYGWSGPLPGRACSKVTAN